MKDGANAGGNPPEPWLVTVSRLARGIRRRVLEFTIRNNGGYLSQACSSAEILATLYGGIMRLGPSVAPPVPPPFHGVPGPDASGYARGDAYHGAKAPHLDRFILSPTHYSLVLYAALVETGRMAPAGLDQFNQDGSTVEMIGAEHSPGMEVMTGSLGQGLSQAAGIAMARKRRGDTGRVWVLMSDGEFQAGMTWEAMQAMAFHHLDNLGVYVDVNGQQCDGRTCEVMTTEPLDGRLEGFGARVHKVNGHGPSALAAPLIFPRTEDRSWSSAIPTPAGGWTFCASEPPNCITYASGMRPNGSGIGRPCGGWSDGDPQPRLRASSGRVGQGTP